VAGGGTRHRWETVVSERTDGLLGCGRGTVPPGLPERECGIPGSAKAAAVPAVVGLALVTAYTVAPESRMAVFARGVLGLMTIGVLATNGTRRV
jgi:hypothetical protein